MFNTKFQVSIRDINYGNHLDHLSLIGYLHEARVQFIRTRGFNENNVDGLHSHLVVVELQCKYKKESFYGDTLNVTLSTTPKSMFKLLFNYTVTRENIVVATAEITVAFINSVNKPILIPKPFLS